MTKVIMNTNMGSITLEIDEKTTPITAKNFIDYAKSGYYNDTIFHRVIDGFMIQGGGMLEDLSPKPNNDPIENESHLSSNNQVGTIAMARTSDPHSATSQFFINVAPNSFLNYTAKTVEGYGYCTFGKVIEGMDIVNKISHVNTVNSNGYQDVPESPIVIKNIEVVEVATA